MGQVKVIRVSGDTGKRSIVEQNMTPEGGRALADQLKRQRPAGSSTTYEVQPHKR